MLVYYVSGFFNSLTIKKERKMKSLTAQMFSAAVFRKHSRCFNLQFNFSRARFSFKAAASPVSPYILKGPECPFENIVGSTMLLAFSHLQQLFFAAIISALSTCSQTRSGTYRVLGKKKKKSIFTSKRNHFVKQKLTGLVHGRNNL